MTESLKYGMVWYKSDSKANLFAFWFRMREKNLHSRKATLLSSTTATLLQTLIVKSKGLGHSLGFESQVLV